MVIVQWWANVFWTPFMIDGFLGVTQSLPLLARLLLFPLSIWLGEVVMGFAIAYVWRTRAWYYRGSDTFFDGNIKLAHGKLWILLGIVVLMIYDTGLVPLSTALAAKLT